MFTEWVDFEFEPVLKRRGDGLCFQIDVNVIGPRDFHQTVNRRLRKDDSEQAVLERIARKYVGKAGRNNR